MPSDIDGRRAARAMFAFLDLLAAHVPGGWTRAGRDGTRLLASGTPLATFNGVFRTDGEPDAADVADYAARAGETAWSVFSRPEPSARLRAAAAVHGLTTAHSSPVMTCPAREIPAAAGVRVVGLDDRTAYIDALAAGYGVPRDLFDNLMSEALMSAPGVTSYLVEVDGEPVATGFGVLAEGLVGVYNIGTPPARRRRGYGRLATEAVMRDGFAAGAEGAYLMSSAMGRSLYSSMGFRLVEDWNYLIAE